MDAAWGCVPAPAYLTYIVCLSFTVQLYVTEEEVARIRGNMSKGLTLLGFKPRSALKPHHSLRPSSFLYPDERAVQGSNVAFISVWQAMLKVGLWAVCGARGCAYTRRTGAGQHGVHRSCTLPRGVARLSCLPASEPCACHAARQAVLPPDCLLLCCLADAVAALLVPAVLQRDAMAICSYVLRDGAEPRLVALLPQEEQYSEWGEQLQPSGMQLINLPFADDIRYPERDAKFTGGQASGGEAVGQQRGSRRWLEAPRAGSSGGRAGQPAALPGTGLLQAGGSCNQQAACCSPVVTRHACR